jgi:catalase
VNQEPNSFGGPAANPAFREPPLKISGDADHYEQKRGVDDDYIQPGNLFRLTPPGEQQRLIAAVVGSLRNAPVEIQKKMVEHFARADPAYGGGIAKGLGLA